MGPVEILEKEHEKILENLHELGRISKKAEKAKGYKDIEGEIMKKTEQISEVTKQIALKKFQKKTERDWGLLNSIRILML